MPGIPRKLAEHALNVDPNAKPVKQSLRRFSDPKRKAISEEIHRLQKAGFIREIKEATWVANPVMVPKKDTDALRMCIDFTDRNKHCPKDHFPLPRIDHIVDSAPTQTPQVKKKLLLPKLKSQSGNLQVMTKLQPRA